MKKTMLMAAAALCLSMPAMANDANMTKDEKAEMKADHYFSQIDSDKNGMISKAEHEAFGEEMFTEADSDKNGTISPDELKSAKKKEMEKMENLKPAAGNN